MKRQFMKTSLAAMFVAAMTLPGFADDRATVTKLYTDFFSMPTSTALPDVAAEVLAPDWKSYGDYSGHANTPEGLIKLFAGIGASVPDLKLEVVEILQDGNRFVVRSRMTGTPVGEFFGMAPTGKSFTIMAIDIHTIVDGKIAESYHIEDWAGAMRQLAAE